MPLSTIPLASVKCPGVAGWGESHPTAWPAAVLALSIFLQREAQETFCWHGEKSHLGALQKVYSFLKVADLGLSAFNFNYLNRGKGKVVFVWPALIYLKSVTQCWKHLFRIPSCLPLAVGFQRVSICSVDFGPMLKLLLGPVATESPPCACSILNLGRYPCCANFKHFLVLPTAGKLLGAVLQWFLSSWVKDFSASHFPVAWTK